MKLRICVTKAQYKTLLGGGTISSGGKTYTFDANTEYLIEDQSTFNCGGKTFTHNTATTVAGIYDACQSGELTRLSNLTISYSIYGVTFESIGISSILKSGTSYTIITHPFGDMIDYLGGLVRAICFTVTSANSVTCTVVDE